MIVMSLEHMLTPPHPHLAPPPLRPTPTSPHFHLAPPPQTRYDVHHALVLAETHHCQVAVLYLYEHKLNM